MEELLHPDGTRDADVQDILVVNMQNLGVLGQSRAARDPPCCSKAVLVGKLAQAAA
jgi:hypothetical protein